MSTRGRDETAQCPVGGKVSTGNSSLGQWLLGVVTVDCDHHLYYYPQLWNVTYIYIYIYIYKYGGTEFRISIVCLLKRGGRLLLIDWYCNRSMEQYAVSTRFKCAKCGKSFGREGDLHRHVTTTSCDAVGAQCLKCSICMTKSSREDNLNRHLWKMHTLNTREKSSGLGGVQQCIVIEAVGIDDPCQFLASAKCDAANNFKSYFLAESKFYNSIWQKKQKLF